MKVLKNAVGLTARLQPKRFIQEFGGHQDDNPQGCSLVLLLAFCARFENFNLTCVRKIFLPFQLKLANQISYIEKFLCLFKLKLTNQISYVSVGTEKMK